MVNRDVLAVGASAGGVEALIFLAKHFPLDLPASVLITIHMPMHARSELDRILTFSGPLRASFARDGERLQKSRIYIAPPNRHLLIDGERLSLGEGPRENNTRPAIDPMLRSTAACCCARAVGVVLTGMLSDGASGLWALTQCGGITVVQDPEDAAFAEMPLSALNRSKPDHIVQLANMPALLDSLVRQPAGKPVPASRGLQYEVDVAKTGHSNMDYMDSLGRRSVLACPDCGGVMWEIDEGEIVRYRCHVGHAYTADLMSLALDESLRRALASALRALEERVALARKLYKQAIERDHHLLAENWLQKARDFEREMDVIRDSIRRMDRLVADEERPKAAE